MTLDLVKVKEGIKIFIYTINLFKGGEEYGKLIDYFFTCKRKQTYMVKFEETLKGVKNYRNLTLIDLCIDCKNLHE